MSNQPTPQQSELTDEQRPAPRWVTGWDLLSAFAGNARSEPEIVREVDQVDWMRLKIAVSALIKVVEDELVEPFRLLCAFYDPFMQWTSYVGSVRDPEGLMDEEPVLAELYSLIRTLDRLSAGHGTVETTAECIAAQQLRRGRPQVSWERWCEACEVVHQFAGLTPPPYWGMLPVPVVGSDGVPSVAGQPALRQPHLDVQEEGE